MGLDMYLTAKRFISGDRYTSKEQREQYNAITKTVGLDKEYVDLPWLHVEVKVAYWRKANAIHGWFVDNVQGGSDDCKSYYVSRETLKELRDLCAKVLAEKDKVVAGENLAPRSGFFFGSYEIDEWYWQDIESTIAQIDRVLQDVPEQCDFYYESSW